MGYRDEAEALRAANAKLKAELAETRERLGELERRGSRSRQKGNPFLGGPTEIVVEIDLEGELSEEGHEILVAELRRELGEIGRTERVGGTLAWSSMGRSSRFVEVTCSSRKERTNLRIVEPLRNLAGGLFGGGVGGGSGGGMVFVVPLSLRFPGLLPFLLAGWVVTLFFVVRAIYGRIAAKRAAQLEGLAQRLTRELAGELQPPRRKESLRLEDAGEPEAQGRARQEAEQEAAEEAEQELASVRREHGR